MKSLETKKIVYYVIVNKLDLKIDKNKINSDTKKARYVLSKMLDYLHQPYLEISISKYGKPYLKNANIYFNYSHSKNYIACAVSNYEVGIDIEETNRVISKQIAKKYLNDEMDNQKKIENWVKKEAYSKLKGLGLLMKFSNINLEDIKNKNLFINNDDYMCSIYCEDHEVIFKRLFL